MTTFLEIAQEACDAIGLDKPTVIVGSTGDTEKRLVAVGNRGGKALARRADWTVLQKEHAFDVVNGTAEYALPSDFDRFIDQTAWDRDAYKTIRGPLTPQQWQVSKSGLIQAAGLDKQWRLKRASASDTSTVYIDPTPDNSTDSLVYEYISKNWCASDGGDDQDAWAADTDVCLLDGELLTLDLIWRMRRSLGLSYQDERDEFDREADQAWARDGGMPVIRLTTVGRIIGEPNIRDGMIGL